MVGTPLLQPAPSPSSDICVRAVTTPVAAESIFAFLDLLFDPWDQGGLEGTVVAVDQVKDLKLTLLSTNNHTTIKSTQSDLALHPKLDKKDTHSEEIFCHRLPGAKNTPHLSTLKLLVTHSPAPAVWSCLVVELPVVEAMRWREE